MKSTHLILPQRPGFVARIAAILGLSLIAATQSVQASSDYGPAIWTPVCSGHWYTSGSGHKFHVIHDMEGYYLSTVSYFQSCSTSSSVHYCVNGKQDTTSDHAAGEVTQMVLESNYGWHALCWNTYSTGTEHEGFVSNPAWYTESMYQASAGITRHIADKFGYAKDRNHVVGHNEGQSAAWRAYAGPAYGINASCNSHTDPGQYWDWNHYMALVAGAPVQHDMIAALYQDGLFQEKEGSFGAWHSELGGCSAMQVSGNRVAALQNGVLYVKDGIDGSWTTQTTAGYVKFQLAGDRIAALSSDGTLWAKDGLYGSWYSMIGGVTAFQLEGNRIGVITGGMLTVKDGLFGGWLNQTGPTATKFQLAGDRIAVLHQDGTMAAKDGPYGTWYNQLGGVSDFHINGDRIAVLQNTVLMVKEGLQGAWTTQTGPGYVKVQLAGNRIGALGSNGTLTVKDGLYGSWYNQIGGVTAFQLEGDRIGVITGGMLTVKYGIFGSWANQTGNNVTSFCLTSWAQ